MKLYFLKFYLIYGFPLFTFGCAGSSMLCGLFSLCSEREGLLSSCGAKASHYVISLVAEHGTLGTGASVVTTPGL